MQIIHEAFQKKLELKSHMQNINIKWVTELNVKWKTIKVFKENKKKVCVTLDLVINFWHKTKSMTPKAKHFVKENFRNWCLLKLKTSDL